MAPALRGMFRLGAMGVLRWSSAAQVAVGFDTRPTELLRDARTCEDPLEFARPEEGAEIFGDHATMGLTLRRHPLALLREQLAGLGVWTSESLRATAEDRQVRASGGIVTHWQQPSTAGGVIFATLEYETGTTNTIVWPSTAKEQRRALRGSMATGNRRTASRPS